MDDESIKEKIAEIEHKMREKREEIAKMIGEVLELVEQNRADLTEAYIVDGKLDQRLCALEAKQSEYKERG